MDGANARCSQFRGTKLRPLHSLSMMRSALHNPQTRGPAGRRAFAEPNLRITGDAPAGGGELTVEVTQQNRSRETFHDVTLRIELGRHVAAEPPEPEESPFDEINADDGVGRELSEREEQQPWPKDWASETTLCSPSVGPGESLSGRCCFSIPDDVKPMPAAQEWWGIDVETTADGQCEYLGTMWIPPASLPNFGLIIPGLVLGAVWGMFGMFIAAVMIHSQVFGADGPLLAALAIPVVSFCGFLGGGYGGFRLARLVSRSPSFAGIAQFAMNVHPVFALFGSVVLAGLTMVIGVILAGILTDPVEQNEPANGQSLRQHPSAFHEVARHV